MPWVRTGALGLVAALMMAGPAVAAAPPLSGAQREYVRGLGPGGVLRLDERTATVSMLARTDGFLSGPRRGDAERVALRWVRSHLDLLGVRAADLRTLRPASRRVSPDGTTRLVWRQEVGGVPLFGHSLRVVVRRDGRILLVGGAPRPGLRTPAPATLARAAAVRAAGGGTVLDARRVVVGTGPRTVRAAWHLVLRASSTAVWDVVVDARTGAVLRRANLVKSEAALAWEHYPGAPAGGAAQAVDIKPWLTDATRLSGPNAHAHTDIDNSGLVTPNEEVAPQPGTSDWLYPYTPVASPNGRCPTAGCIWNHLVSGSWAANREQDATQLFASVNRFHDHLAAPPISFGPAQGAFEGDDPVLASAMDGAAVAAGRPVPLSGTNTANFFTPPDGRPGQMQMYLFENGAVGPDDLVSYGPFSDVSSASDAATVYHEYTHGLTNRLVTREDGYGALDGVQSGAIGEGTSDFYALDKLLADGHESDTERPGELRYGAFLDGGRDLLRTEPLDCTVGAPASACPRTGTALGGAGGYTYADLGKIAGGPDVHRDGEIWAQTLFDLRRRLVGDHGPQEGTRRMRALLTRALEMVVADPSFLDLRDAILLADTSSGGRERRRIWEAFAARGMGRSATPAPEAAFDIPPGLPAADSIGPAMIIEEPDPAAVVRGEDVLVVGSAVDDAGVAEVRVNGVAAAVRDDTWMARLQLPAGPQRLTVTGRDIEGRESSDARTVISDRAVPVVSRARLRRGTLTATVTDDVGLEYVRVGRRSVIPTRAGRIRAKVRGRRAVVTVSDRAGRVVRVTVRSRR